MTNTHVKENPLFSKFGDVLKSVLNVPVKGEIGNFWERGRKLKYADMFCGIGGFHSAADSLGMECVFACDIDENVRKIYEYNYGIKPESDICQIKPSAIPDHDILFAGFPCQPFSIIGNGGGFADARGTLFFELAKIIETKRPSGFILENVKQLASHNKGRTLARILEILRGLGYTVNYKIFNALNFGLPQKRERILIVGFNGNVDGFSWPSLKVPMIPLKEILEENPGEQHFVSDRIKKKRKAEHKAKVKPAIWHENKAGNISSHPYSCALRAGASYNYLLVDGERRLTPRELVRLQGFPESFKIIGTDSEIRKQAGNSVPVPIVKAVMESVLHARRTEVKRSIKAA
jgi:DNA (cytosine-5)-methyltransferase 1